MKKPLIYLDIGGPKDFVDKETGYPVKVGKLVPSRQLWLMNQYINGVWAEPNFVDLKIQMKKVYDDYGDAMKKAHNGYKNVKKNFTWDGTIDKIKDAIKELKE